MTRKRKPTRNTFQVVQPTPVSLPKKTCAKLLALLGRDGRDPDAENIRRAVEAVLTNLSVVAALSRVTFGQARAEMRRVLDAARALDDALGAPSMDVMFRDTEGFCLDLDEFITASEAVLRSLPAKTRQRSRRYDLRSAVPRFNGIFKRYYRHRPGERPAQVRDAFIRAALEAGGIRSIPDSRQLRRYLNWHLVAPFPGD
jgi:hypothetical protein